MTAPGPIDFLPVAFGFVWQFGAYVCVAQFTAYAYDWLISIPEECAMVANSGITWSISIYFLSRVCEFTFLGLILLFGLVTIENCQLLIDMTGMVGVIGGAATTFLFFLRVRAVYMKSTRVTALFGALWLVTLALGIFAATTLRAGHIPSTQYCLDTSVNYVTLPSISTFAHDTTVFLAISYRLAADAATELTWRSRVLSVIKGKGLHSLSKSLMQSGQKYYFATVLFFLANLALLVSPVPPSARFALTTMHLGFTNIMACHVFRGVALGAIERTPTGLSSTRIAAAFQLSPMSSGAVKVS
ncbi:hypothetical protein FIBSPDRAFT_1051017 [Athelia psychrophila]|uniref:DUF6533 domain-containing protein n=1 Tax=Athelia psychrophila TaxID=1759441 RepID=A0A165ZWA8_9AGAM|nr:hypothetical protein FIBSPDRAFT_1051017 [Fibularhizoctonia sp. CBS 109695]